MKKHLRSFAFSLLFCAPVALPAATISIQTTCMSAEGVTVNTDNGCAFTDGPNGNVKASASVNWTPAPDPASFSQILSQTQVFAQIKEISTTQNPTAYLPTSAAVNLTIMDELSTAGSTRPGYVQIQIEGGFDRTGGAAASQKAIIDGISIFASPYGVFYMNHTFPIELGESFSILYQTTSQIAPDYQEGQGAAITSANIQFRFFEADEITPVAVTELPEPGTFALFGLSLAGLAWWGKKHAQSKRKAVPLVALAVLAPFVMPGATITIQTTCQAALQQPFTTDNGCSVPAVPPTPGNVGGGQVNAAGSAAFTLGSLATDWTTFSVHAFSSATPLDVSTPQNPYNVKDTSASSQVILSAMLTTDGPVRSGLVQIQSSGSVFHTGTGSGSGLLLLGSVQGSPSGFNHTFEITLGDDFLLQYTANTYSNGNAAQWSGGSSSDYQAQFRFFEADGITPVAVSEVASAPEPGTFTLLGLSLAGLGWWGKKRASAS